LNWQHFATVDPVGAVARLSHWRADVELESLGALREMQVGDKIAGGRSYTLIRRENADASFESRRILGR
jgi:hypothetical protein